MLTTGRIFRMSSASLVIGDKDAHRWLSVAAASGLALSVALLLFGLPPIDLHPPIHRAGIMDPFCGGTRSAWLTVHGRLVAAWRYNPLGIAAVFAAVLATARTITGSVSGRWWNLEHRLTPRARWALLLVGLVLLAGLEWRQQGRADLLMSTSLS